MKAVKPKHVAATYEWKTQLVELCSCYSCQRFENHVQNILELKQNSHFNQKHELKTIQMSHNKNRSNILIANPTLTSSTNLYIK